MASSRSLGVWSTRSRMAFAPLREIAIDLLQMRDHRSLLTRNHLPKHARFQAPRCRPNELAPKPRTTRDRWTISLTMTTGIREVEAAATSTSPPANPVQRVTARSTPRADHPHP